jgi:3-phenylpropionate/trans-cinnamate dioxygenase ferredoxin reductase subunit
VATPGTIVIVGASLAGATAAATLRDEGFDGSVVLLGAESLPPYERPGLSKEVLRGEQPIEEHLVRPPEWYADHEIELRTGTRAVQLDPSAREVVLAGGERVGFDRLILATGCRNRMLAAPGSSLPGIFELRTAEHAAAIREAAAVGARVVCVGMGFVGAEVAASLRTLGCDVTVVEVFETTLYRILGPDIGRVLEGIHRDHGVTMVFNDTVASFVGDGRVEAVVTSAGRRIECDLVVVGVGTEPSVELMAGTGLDQGSGIPVGPTLETEPPPPRVRTDPRRALRQRPEDGGGGRSQRPGRCRGVRRPALVLVRPVRAPGPDGWLRAHVGPDGGAGLARGSLVLLLPARR